VTSEPRSPCIVLSAEDVTRFSTDPAVLADGLRLANHFHAIGLGVRLSAVAASAAWMVTGMAQEIECNPALNPDGLSRLQIARWLLTMIDVQLIAIDQMDAVDRVKLGELFRSREIAAPPGVCWSSGGVARTGAVPAVRKQRRRCQSSRSAKQHTPQR
jgi:hypothetical protein